MTLAIAAILVAGVLAFILLLRPKDLPEEEPVSPVAHLEQRKQRVYEGLRDLQFEYRVGKLSDQDYQSTKTGLQKELAGVMAEIDRLLGGAPGPPEKAGAAPPPAPKSMCGKCGASFEKPLRFCGECGAPMQEAAG